MNKKFLVVLSLAVVMLLALTACGGTSPVVASDLPAYPGATELGANDSRLAATLSKNSQQITALTQSAGVNGKTEQKGFALPKETTWDNVKKFYDDKLKAAGWNEPGGMTGNVLAQVNAQNDMFQTATYLRGNQTLAVIRLVDPISKDASLIFSLNTR